MIPDPEKITSTKCSSDQRSSVTVTDRGSCDPYLRFVCLARFLRIARWSQFYKHDRESKTEEISAIKLLLHPYRSKNRSRSHQIDNRVNYPGKKSVDFAEMRRFNAEALLQSSLERESTSGGSLFRKASRKLSRKTIFEVFPLFPLSTGRINRIRERATRFPSRSQRQGSFKETAWGPTLTLTMEVE